MWLSLALYVALASAAPTARGTDVYVNTYWPEDVAPAGLCGGNFTAYDVMHGWTAQPAASLDGTTVLGGAVPVVGFECDFRQDTWYFEYGLHQLGRLVKCGTLGGPIRVHDFCCWDGMGAGKVTDESTEKFTIQWTACNATTLPPIKPFVDPIKEFIEKMEH